MKGFRLPSLF